MTPQHLDRLAKLCGMFGSAHDGERAAAARKADDLVRELGLTWCELFAPLLPEPAPPAPPRPTWTENPSRATALALLLDRIALLTEWEKKFITSCADQMVAGRRLTQKQWIVIDDIYDKVRAVLVAMGQA